MIAAARVIMALAVVSAAVIRFLQKLRVGDKVSAEAGMHIRGNPRPVVI